MKKSILGALLGAAMVTVSYGQGHILISNYLTPPFNQVVWANNASLAPAGMANKAVSDFSLQFQVFYGKGTLTDPSALTGGNVFTLDNSGASTSYDPGAGHGGGGYFLNVDQVLPTWASGDTYTFMYSVVTPGYSGSSALWQEKDQIVSTAGSALAASTVPGLTIAVPEPTSLALLGLGASSLLFFRRKKA